MAKAVSEVGKKIVAKFVGVLALPLSLVEAYYDFGRYVKLSDRGYSEWSKAYMLSGILGGGSAILSFVALVLFSGPLGIAAVIVGLAYAILLVVIAIFSPDGAELWLSQCYFGKFRNTNWDKNWQSSEIGEFKRLNIPKMEAAPNA
jgi:hypothetical protein